MSNGGKMYIMPQGKSAKVADVTLKHNITNAERTIQVDARKPFYMVVADYSEERIIKYVMRSN